MSDPFCIYKVHPEVIIRSFFFLHLLNKPVIDIKRSAGKETNVKCLKFKRLETEKGIFFPEIKHAFAPQRWESFQETGCYIDYFQLGFTLAEIAKSYEINSSYKNFLKVDSP